MESKEIIFGIGIVFVLIILGIFCTKSMISGISGTESSLTKAICDQNNYCEDYEISCNGQEVVKMTPTGATIQFSESWEDPRTQEDKEILCN
jgi:hypothetical protein